MAALPLSNDRFVGRDGQHRVDNRRWSEASPIGPVPVTPRCVRFLRDAGLFASSLPVQLLLP